MDKPGLELLYTHVSEQLNGPQDALVCILHWKIISNGFKCTGVGDEPTGKHKKTENLPAGWNRSSDVYVLKYGSTETNENFTLKVVKVDDTLLVNFMRDGDEKVASMPLRVADYVTDNIADFDEAFQNLPDLTKRFKKEIMSEFKPASPPNTSQGWGRGSDQRAGRSRPYGEDRPRGRGGSHRPQPDWPERVNPFDIGRGDLDPFGQGVGGMMMDPRRARGPRFGINPSAGMPGLLPRGAVPPGARFDPFGPGARSDPDPDHMRPPSGYDDMPW